MGDREEGREEEERLCGRMLLVAGESVKTCGRQGLSPLMAACRAGRAGLAAWLCQQGAGLDRREGRGWTALMFSVDSGHGQVARLLLERGADTSLVSSDGQKAADIAAASGSGVLQEVLELWGVERGLGGRKEVTREARVRCSQVENILLGLDLGECTGLFREGGVGLEEFLLLREPELEALGVVRLGDRKKLMAAQGEIHRY